MIRQTKRQRRTQPTSWLDCETLQVVPYLNHYITTPLASDLLQELFEQRFQSEIVNTNWWNDDALSTRLIVEPNRCTELLEEPPQDADDLSSPQQPTLLVLSNNVNPPTALIHYIVLAKQRNVPVLLMPSNRYGMVMVFVQTTKSSGNSDLDRSVDSFVEYILEKMRQEQREINAQSIKADDSKA